MVRLRSEQLFDALVAALLVIVGLICLIPMLYVVAVFLTPYDEYLRRGGMILPNSRLPCPSSSTPSPARAANCCATVWKAPITPGTAA